MFSKKDPKINIYEVLISIITYSASSLNEKLRMAFETFDFDKNEVITKDEMTILCISFLRGVATMTESSQYNRKFSEVLASEAFKTADTNPDGMVTFEE
jgi:Ca2+-binding EF-hand superfamily protein